MIVADGGTGALVTAAVPRLRCPEEANVKDPEAVLGVHLGFIRAGAELIEANTFEVPGITIPEAVQERLASAGPDARGVGFELARQLIEESRARAAGVYVITPFREPTAALDPLDG